MQLRIVAVGQRLPAWAQQGCDDYLKRFPPEWRVEVKAIKAEPRETRSVQQCLQGERIRIEAAIPRGAHIVALDERGRRLDTMALAQLMTQWQLQAQDVAVLIGGADGLEPALRAQAHDCLRLSDLTLPHALARLMLVEQLYRAWSINAQHPYHRA